MVLHARCPQAPVLKHGAPQLVRVHAEGKAVRWLEARQAAAVGDQGGFAPGRDVEGGRVHHHACQEGRAVWGQRQPHPGGVLGRTRAHKVHLRTHAGLMTAGDGCSTTHALQSCTVRCKAGESVWGGV